MIELRGISKSFRVMKRKKGVAAAIKGMLRRDYTTVKALDSVSFRVNRGDIIGFIGPNGAGKSTAIKIMSGILVPDAGECEIMGITPWKNREEYVSQIGVVFGHRTQLWWDVPVQDSYDLLKDIYKIPEKQYIQTLTELTETFDIKALLHIPLRQMSLGQRMRCEIVASLLHNPQILFLDEPTIGLDAASKLAVRQLIKQLNEKFGITVILTTHDMDDIEAVTNRIVLIGKGKIIYDGSMRRIREEYDQVRTLAVSFKEHSTPVIPNGAELDSWRSTRATYKVDVSKANISEILNHLGNTLSIFDITVETSPIEEIIALFCKDRNI